MVEHSAVNRVVVGSSPTRGVFFFLGSMVKRLRHRPFTAVTRVRFPLESLEFSSFVDVVQFVLIARKGNMRQSRLITNQLLEVILPMWLNWQSS